jgi:hypothetical protein
LAAAPAKSFGCIHLRYAAGLPVLRLGPSRRLPIEMCNPEADTLASPSSFAECLRDRDPCPHDLMLILEVVGPHRGLTSRFGAQHEIEEARTSCSTSHSICSVQTRS